MKNKLIIFLFCIIGLCGIANAQSLEIKGQVVDNQGLPLIMVNVVEVGTTNGTVTDMDGNYVINVSEGSVIEFSFIGYTSIKKTVSAGMNEINVTLLEDTQVLEDVVVTALGIKRQEKALSYNVQSVKQDELTRVKDANLINSLNGKIAGVNIQTSSSGVGGATKVVMRGVKSIEGSNNALYVIDGVPMFNSVGEEGSGRYSSRGSTEGIADLNPEDIESMTVLTGASAAALYGSSAANGAILITTKKGKEGRLEATFSSSMEFAHPFIMPEFQNTYGSLPNAAVSWGGEKAGLNGL